MLRSQGDHFVPPAVWRTVPSVRWKDVKLLPGDFDGDGHGDMALALDTGAGALEVRVFRPDGSGLPPRGRPGSSALAGASTSPG